MKRRYNPFPRGKDLFQRGQDFFDTLVSLENLFVCWKQYRRGKRHKKDIQVFERYLEEEIFDLHQALRTQTYRHGAYATFSVHDPKKRAISKATVRDRLVHELLYAALLEIFDPRFVFHSLSCRPGKGVHLGLGLLQRMLLSASRSGKGLCWALKMDVRRFFDSVNHHKLLALIHRRVRDKRVLCLIKQVLSSFILETNLQGPRGLPLGNVTSQLFSNLYLHELDLFIKHRLKHKHYLRYCDDFVLVHAERAHLESLVKPIEEFLKGELFLDLHPQKILWRKGHQGVDFLGYVVFLWHKVLRRSSQRRMLRRLKETYQAFLEERIEKDKLDATLQSYLDMLSHTHQRHLTEDLSNSYGVRALDFFS